MKYQGSCHCGTISFSVEGTLEQVLDCNCSHCRRKGYLLWFVPRNQLEVTAPDDQVAIYTFNHHVIKHHFCLNCGCAPFGLGTSPAGVDMAGVNVRCLDAVDLSTLKVVPVDGRSL